MSNYTVAFDEFVEGWTSFYSYNPEWMLRLGNNFFTFKNGQLYIHHDESVPRNNFYGEQYSSKLKFAVNHSPSDIKVIKSLGIEGNVPWEVLIHAYQSDSEDPIESTIKGVEFIKKEGYWYSHTRRNESETDTSSKSTYGIGEVSSRNGNSLEAPKNDVVAEGDKIFTASDGAEIGVVTGVNGTTITLDKAVPAIEGEYIYGTKDARIEGGELRGYTAVIELVNNDTIKVELFGTNAEVFKSHR